MTFTHQLTADTLHLSLAGDLLGLADEQRLLQWATSELDDAILFCLVDISQVAYMNSTGLTLLIRLLTHFRTRNGEMVVVGPSAAVQKLLVITKLSAIFQVFDHPNQARQYLQGLAVSAK
ncbi:MAG: STAS domain-containing protein [Bernardetiaceae bacterium]|jgi:anti-sigma B factor antagonist|nr:STAS domain-containing protein [Bernardetiaceae bacterium]